MQKQILLHNIRSAHNVGSIFRTADGAGVSKIYLSGYTPSPIDRFGRELDEIKKTSLGATHTVPWEVVEGEVLSFVQQKKEESTSIIAVELDSRAVSIYDFTQPEQALYIFGNEIEGVEGELLEIADTILAIPMQGSKESLNVSVAAGIVLFR